MAGMLFSIVRLPLSFLIWSSTAAFVCSEFRAQTVSYKDQEIVLYFGIVVWCAVRFCHWLPQHDQCSVFCRSNSTYTSSV